MDNIYVTKSSMPPFEEYINEIQELWESHWLTNMGQKHLKLEKLLGEYLSVSNIALCVNGHMALETVFSAMELKGEVITTPFTFVSTTNAIVRCGLKPVFCDIKIEDYTIDADLIEPLVTSKTVAIVPVHVYGHICDQKRITQIAEKYHLRVIYDAAHAFGVKENGRSVASYGDASVYSFHATKVFNTIEGGAIVYRDSRLTDVINNIKNFGITSEESVAYIGGNAKMNEFQAAMGICNLRHLEDEIHKRKIIYETYLEALQDIPEIVMWYVPKDEDYNYSYFPILIKGDNRIRDNVYEVLKNKKIYSRKYFYPIVTECECYRRSFDALQTPVSLYVSKHILTLPIYADLKLEQVYYICKSIRSFFYK